MDVDVVLCEGGDSENGPVFRQQHGTRDGHITDHSSGETMITCFHVFGDAEEVYLL
jgi:hypothetical protein